MNVKVSVIIPVYNCEKYIEECIESLINQTLQECEFIFVNDGSKDKSEEIIKKYADKDERITLINQKNSGVSVARNVGIKKAVGEYIGFVDADDYVESDYYEKLYNTAKNNNCSIVVCNWKSQINGKENKLSLPFEKDKILNKSYIEEKIYPFLIENDSFNSVCNKLFNSNLIKENKVEFPVGIELGEDGAFNVQAFTYCKDSYYIDYCGYNYREVEGSATRNIVKKDYFKRALNVYESNLKEYDKWPIKKDKIEKLKAIKFLNVVIGLTYIYFVPNENTQFKDRYLYVKNMINNETVSRNINKYYELISKNKGRYEKKIIDCIKNKNTVGIYLLTLYSRLRNR